MTSFAMRAAGVLCLCGTVAAADSSARSQQPASPAPADAAAVLAATRQAMGGDEKLSAVKRFVATGRTRQVRGNNIVPIEFEIACELPDRYVRRDEVPAQESGPTSSGFSGETLVQVPLPPPSPVPSAMPAGGVPRPASPTAAPAPAAAQPSSTPTSPAASPAPAGAAVSAPGAPASPAGAAGTAPAPMAAPPDPRKARVTSLKQDFVRLTLGMFATSFSSYPLTFTLAGRAEAPQGTADVIDAKGPGNFSLRLFVDSATHLPIMVSWTVPATNVVIAVQGQPAPQNIAPGSVVVQAPPLPGPTATKDEQEAYAKEVQDLRKKALATAKPVEHRLYYADYRDVDGMRFPFRLRRAIGSETIEETNFDGFKINPRIDPRKFESR